MDHRVDRDADANVCSRRRDDIHWHMQPADTAKHAERDKRQAHNHRYRSTNRPGDDPCDRDKQNVEPKEAGHEAGSDQLRQAALQIVNTANKRGLESVFPRDRAKVVDNINAVFGTTLLNHA